MAAGGRLRGLAAIIASKTEVIAPNPAISLLPRSCFDYG